MRFKIILNDTPTDVSFGITATELFCELKKIELNEVDGLIGKNMSFLDLRDLLFSGIKAACLEDGDECEDKVRHQVAAAMDKMDGDELMDLLIKFSESLPSWASKPEKKKVTAATQGGSRKKKRP